jgi:hypothetical protein
MDKIQIKIKKDDDAMMQRFKLSPNDTIELLTQDSAATNV